MANRFNIVYRKVCLTWCLILFSRCSKNCIHGTLCAISIIDFSSYFGVLNISHKYTIIGSGPIFIRIKCMLVFGLNQFEYAQFIIYHQCVMIIHECITFEISQSYIFTLMNIKSTVLKVLLFSQECEIIKSSLFFNHTSFYSILAGTQYSYHGYVSHHIVIKLYISFFCFLFKHFNVNVWMSNYHFFKIQLMVHCLKILWWWDLCHRPPHWRLQGDCY